MSVLANVLSGSLNKNVPKILSTDDDGEDLEPPRGSGRGVGEGEGEHADIENGNLSELLVLTNKNHKYDQVVDELDEVKKTMKLILETLADKQGRSRGGEGGAVPGNSEEEEGGDTADRFQQYDTKISELTEQLKKDKEEMNKMLIESQKEILQSLNSNQNPQTILREIPTQQQRQDQQQT